MNVQAFSGEDEFRRMENGENIVSYRFGHGPSDKSIYRPFRNSSQTHRKRYEDTKGSNHRFMLTSSGRNSPERGALPLESEEEEAAAEVRLHDFKDDSDELRRQEDRHEEFIKSCQGWVNDGRIDVYQTSRMPISLAIKKGHNNHRSARGSTENQLHILQGNQYKQTNIFPVRKNNSVKKMPRRHESPMLKPQNLKYKGEGELKVRMNLMRTPLNHEVRREIRKSPQAGICRASSAILKTFSNPRILLIENRQLVKGIKMTIL